jgi:hypothetical protein
MELGEYIKAAMQKPFEWGVHDCGSFCGEWMGITIPAYKTGDQADDLIKKHGGLAELYDFAIGEAAQLIDEPIAGSVGVIKVGGIEVGGIYSGERWIIFGDKGMRAIPHSPLHVEAMWYG